MNIQSYAVFWPDHLFVMIFAVLYPVYGFVSYRKYVHKLRSGEISRRRAYIRNLLSQWVLAFMGIALWQVQRRDWADLGISLTIDRQFLFAALSVLLVIAFFLWQLLTVRKADAKLIARLSSEFKSVEDILPQTPSELHAFYGLSLTAGIVEELLWRGFLIAYLSHFVPVWAAAVLSALVFGIGHAYQGIANTPKIVAVGLALSGLYILSGSLWLPMLLHMAADALQGRTAFDFMRVNTRNDGASVTA